MVTTKLKTVKCSCDCNMTILEIDAIYDNYEQPYADISHMSDDYVNDYLGRYYDEAIEELLR